MTNYSGTVLSAPVVVGTDLDKFPTHKSEFGKGGWHEVANTTERDAIPAERRAAGMAVFVTETSKLYTLDNNLTTWTEFTTGGAGGTATWGNIEGNIADQVDLNEEMDPIKDALRDDEANLLPVATSGDGFVNLGEEGTNPTVTITANANYRYNKYNVTPGQTLNIKTKWASPSANLPMYTFATSGNTVVSKRLYLGPAMTTHLCIVDDIVTVPETATVLYVGVPKALDFGIKVYNETIPDESGESEIGEPLSSLEVWDSYYSITGNYSTIVTKQATSNTYRTVIYDVSGYRGKDLLIQDLWQSENDSPLITFANGSQNNKGATCSYFYSDFTENIGDIVDTDVTVTVPNNAVRLYINVKPLDIENPEADCRVYQAINPAGEYIDVGELKKSLEEGKQDKLVSGTNIKTVNNTSLLGTGNVAVQPTLVSGTNIKTVNNQSILGEGNINISGSGAIWGEILGELEDQTDLNDALTSSIEKRLDELEVVSTENGFIYTNSGGTGNTAVITSNVNYHTIKWDVTGLAGTSLHITTKWHSQELQIPLIVFVGNNNVILTRRQYSDYTSTADQVVLVDEDITVPENALQVWVGSRIIDQEYPAADFTEPPVIRKVMSVSDIGDDYLQTCTSFEEAHPLEPSTVYPSFFQINNNKLQIQTTGTLYSTNCFAVAEGITYQITTEWMSGDGNVYIVAFTDNENNSLLAKQYKEYGTQNVRLSLDTILTAPEGSTRLYISYRNEYETPSTAKQTGEVAVITPLNDVIDNKIDAALTNISETYATKTDIKNSTITFKQGTLTKGTITLNQASDATITFAAGEAGTEDTLWRSKLSGKRVSILGDSISTYQGYLTPSSNTVYYPTCQGSPYADLTSVDQTWWKIVIDKAGMVLGANNSYSGRTLMQSATTANITALGTNGDPDIILVYLGTNDANQQVTLGTINTDVPFNVNSSESYGETLGTNLTQEQVNELGTSTFYEALRTLIIRCQWYYPNARLVFLTLGWGSYERFYANNPYREAQKEVCELMGVDTIDVRCAFPMSKFTNFTLQRVHPNKAGMAVLGEYVYNQLMSLWGYTEEIGAKTLSTLTYTGTLTKTAYVAGESFDSAGLTFTATYSDGSTNTVTPAFTPNPLTAGTTSVTASYTYGNTTKTVIISGITVEEVQPTTFVNDSGYTYQVINNLNEAVLQDNKAHFQYSDPTHGYTAINGRIAAYVDGETKPGITGYALAVSGGDTITWTPNADITSKWSEFAYSIYEYDTNGNSIPAGVVANTWLTANRTLQSNTKYIAILFRLKSAREEISTTAEEKAKIIGSISIS